MYVMRSDTRLKAVSKQAAVVGSGTDGSTHTPQQHQRAECGVCFSFSSKWRVGLTGRMFCCKKKKKKVKIVGFGQLAKVSQNVETTAFSFGAHALRLHTFTFLRNYHSPYSPPSSSPPTTSSAISLSTRCTSTHKHRQFPACRTVSTSACLFRPNKLALHLRDFGVGTLSCCRVAGCLGREPLTRLDGCT